MEYLPIRRDWDGQARFHLKARRSDEDGGSGGRISSALLGNSTR